MIEIQVGEEGTVQCDSVILIPEKSLDEAGYIKAFSSQSGGHDKHEFHAMSQVVYFQYQDDELEVQTMDGPIHILHGEESETISDGMVIYRDLEGSF